MKIGHGPATVIGWRFARAESQETYPNWSKLTLFAREGVAIASLYSRGFFIGENLRALGDNFCA